MKNVLRQKLNKTDSLCVTVELWNNRQMKGFMVGITGHYLLDWVL